MSCRDAYAGRVSHRSDWNPESIPTSVERVEKPWGHEEIFAVSEGEYVGKTLHIDAGECLSLHYHRHKHETVSVLTGRILLDAGLPERELGRHELSAGQAFEIPAGVLHRITALEQALVLEASTAAPGWRDDVVRLEDRYGRVVTSGV